MFRYPDFFKVGISESGNHDNRNYEDDWAEKWQGLLERKRRCHQLRQPGEPELREEPERQAAARARHDGRQRAALDNTLLVVDELIKANKDFDLLMMPNRRHGYAAEPYMIRRRWDYFVRHLLDAQPPQGYELRPTAQ